MTKIIELAHTLGIAISESDEIRALSLAKEAYDSDAALQAKLAEYETDRKLLTEEFIKEDNDTKEETVAKLREHMESLAAEIVVNEKYVAFTQAQGSSATNVIPPEASLVSNIRLNPADDMESALEYIKKTVGDENVEVTCMHGMNPSRISRTDCEGFERVASAVASTWKGCIVAPYLMVQCSDSRHWGRISDRVYRFSAMDLTSAERASIHGNNEKIRIDALGRTVEFFIRLMKKC